MPRKRTPKRESLGHRERLGRPVRDAAQVMAMPFTHEDIVAAAKKRRKYDVDDPDNFRECVAATCFSKVAGCEIEIFRKHAYVALPGEEHTWRFEIARSCWEVVRLNDLGEFDKIPANTVFELRPPCPSRRLAEMRARDHRVRAARGGRAKPTGRVQPVTDPHRGVYRNGVFSTD